MFWKDFNVIIIEPIQAFDYFDDFDGFDLKHDAAELLQSIFNCNYCYKNLLLAWNISKLFASTEF